MQELKAVDLSDKDYTCDYVTNQIILHITQFKSLFYFLVNGSYLGQMGDYSACRAYTNNGQFILATISGDYSADFPFSRGSFGKYFDDFSIQMGLCVPQQCDLQQIKDHIEPLLVRYAEEANWENPRVDYIKSWHEEHYHIRTFDTNWKTIGVIIFAILSTIVAIGSCVELTSIGDDPEFDKEILKELNKFKSTDQYEAVIMQ